ncbi:MAG TPA: NAD(P)-dependent alcohol dehydrogenase [Polyangiaceae bacterium]|nr:NAD(P)-dependent alcohol dehydrogenase [Polyangiaceae bacterium]
MNMTTINAYAVKYQAGKAEPFSYERQLGGNDVLVRVTHCSIARGDIQIIDNDWGDTRFPLVPGHEIVGVVEEVGSTVAGLKKGDRVGIGYQQGACFSCQFCKEGNEQLCPTQKVIGIDCHGGLADHIGVDHRFAFKLPPMLDSAKSTPLLSSGLTVYAAIVRAQLPNRSEVAVLGIGGLGHLAIQFLREMGHSVSAFSHSPTKRELIQQLGATYIDSSHLAELTTLRRRFDFILSTLNTKFDLDAYLGMLRPQGKLCFVAQPLEKMSVSVGMLYDNAQRTLYGSYVGSREAMMAMLAFAEEHQIESIVDVMPFDKVNEAIDRVRSGKVPMRLVLQR